MDEPLSNLDAKLRVQTRAELVELQRRLEATIVYVTHDQVEAMTMGHRIAIMNEGVLQQIGPPQDVYARAGEPVRRPVHRQPADEHRRRAASPATATRSSSRSPAAGHRSPPRSRTPSKRRGSRPSCSACARAPAARRRRGSHRDGRGRRVARPRAPRGLPARRRADGDRPPARPGRRSRAGRRRSHLDRARPSRCTCSIPTTGHADRPVSDERASRDHRGARPRRQQAHEVEGARPRLPAAAARRS